MARSKPTPLHTVLLHRHQCRHFGHRQSPLRMLGPPVETLDIDRSGSNRTARRIRFGSPVQRHAPILLRAAIHRHQEPFGARAVLTWPLNMEVTCIKVKGKGQGPYVESPSNRQRRSRMRLKSRIVSH
jgi:hypothetical protein